jgi:hypothetical protein
MTKSAPDHTVDGDVKDKGRGQRSPGIVVRHVHTQVVVPRGVLIGNEGRVPTQASTKQRLGLIDTGDSKWWELELRSTGKHLQ